MASSLLLVLAALHCCQLTRTLPPTVARNQSLTTAVGLRSVALSPCSPRDLAATRVPSGRRLRLRFQDVVDLGLQDGDAPMQLVAGNLRTISRGLARQAFGPPCGVALSHAARCQGCIAIADAIAWHASVWCRRSLSHRSAAVGQLADQVRAMADQEQSDKRRVEVRQLRNVTRPVNRRRRAFTTKRLHRNHHIASDKKRDSSSFGGESGVGRPLVLT
jgi:hypothetical protein